MSLARKYRIVPTSSSWVSEDGAGVDNSLFCHLQMVLLRASSYEPGNRAGSVTVTNFVVCSYGKFQPGLPGWNLRNTTKMVDHKRLKVVSFAAVVALWILVTLLIELIRILLQWKTYKTKIMPFWPLCCESEARLPKKFRPKYPGWRVHMVKSSSR